MSLLFSFTHSLFFFFSFFLFSTPTGNASSSPAREKENGTEEEEATSTSTSSPSRSPSRSPSQRRLFSRRNGRGASPSPSPSSNATTTTTIADSNPSAKLAARKLASQHRSSPSPSKYAPLTLDQAAAIDENAGAITRRVDAKAAQIRRDALSRLFLCLALTAAALRALGPVAGAAVGALCGVAFGSFLRSRNVARQWAARRRTHETVARARAALAAAAAGGERASRASSRFDGTWLRDPAASDSMERALDVMAIRGIVRKAIALVKGLHLKVDVAGGGGSSSNPSSSAGLFTLQVFSVIPILKITERYPLTGAPVEHRRRDLRPGRAAGATELVDGGSRLRTTLVWKEPRAGAGTDTYEVSEDGKTLTVSSWLRVDGETASYRVVYRKVE